MEIKLILNDDGSVKLVDENAGGREANFDFDSSFANELDFELQELGWRKQS